MKSLEPRVALPAVLETIARSQVPSSLKSNISRRRRGDVVPLLAHTFSGCIYFARFVSSLYKNERTCFLLGQPLLWRTPVKGQHHLFWGGAGFRKDGRKLILVRGPWTRASNCFCARPMARPRHVFGFIFVVKVAVCSHMNVEDDPERREDRMKGREIERCTRRWPGKGGCGGSAAGVPVNE